MNRINLHLPLLAGSSAATRIELDDHDIAHAVTRIQVDAGVDGLTTVHLRLQALEVVQLDGEARVFLDSSVVDLLVRHGWTPPDQADPTVLRATEGGL